MGGRSSGQSWYCYPGSEIAPPGGNHNSSAFIRHPMKKRERLCDRFIKDELSIRIAWLAADLARIASSTRHPTGDVNTTEMLEES